MVYVAEEVSLNARDVAPRLDRRPDLDRFGPYLVVDSIATGGMAQIYKVRHEADPTVFYALKCIRPDCDDDPEFRRMLLDEARITGQLDHPNINQVVEVVRFGGRVALLLEHVEGIDLVGLKRHLRHLQKPLSLPLVLHILREVLAALDYAHRAGSVEGAPLQVVHRDVSPGNVMIDVHGRVILIDFGIARAQGRLAQTEVGSVKGKFRYMAPEQIKGADVRAPADIYAAAVLLWELLSGRRIHDDVPVAKLMMRVANAEVPPLAEARPGLPEGLARVYARATALVPEARFQTAADFADALRDAYEIDEESCRAQLAEYALAGSSIDQHRSYAQAVARARIAAEHGLEDAILSALEDPDRVERVEMLGVRPAELYSADVDDDEDITEFGPPIQTGAAPRPQTAAPLPQTRSDRPLSQPSAVPEPATLPIPKPLHEAATVPRQQAMPGSGDRRAGRALRSVRLLPNGAADVDPQ